VGKQHQQAPRRPIEHRPVNKFPSTTPTLSLNLTPTLMFCAQIRRQHIQGMGIDISVGESLDEVADLLERAAAPFQDLTWDRIFPMPTAGALAGEPELLRAGSGWWSGLGMGLR